MSERLFLGAAAWEVPAAWEVAAPRCVPAAVHAAHRTASGSASDRTRELPLAIHVGELRIARQESEHNLPHGPVAVLRDDDVGLAGTFRVAVVVLVAVDEHHEVGVLLDLP